MKSCCLFVVFSLALCCHAAEKQIELIAGQEETQVFFLACADLHIAPASLRLTCPDGTDVPFSLDWRYDIPAKFDRHYASNGRYVAKPDGFYSKWNAPADENQFSHLGWLSFQKHPGIERYILAYHIEAGGVLDHTARPHPDVRPWWIEIMRDSELQDLKQLSFKEGTLSVHPNGGVEFSRTFWWPKESYLLNEQLEGRRLIAFTRLAGCNGFFTVPFFNAVLLKNPVINCYFSSAEPIDHLIEGRTGGRTETLFRSTRGGLSLLGKTTPEKRGRMYFFHLQSPPEDGGIEIRLNSTLFNRGDRARLSVSGFGHELMYLLMPGVERVENWEAEYTIQADLKNGNGHQVATYDTVSFQLSDIPSGCYTLEVALHSQRKITEIIVAKNFPVEIQTGPDWD